MQAGAAYLVGEHDFNAFKAEGSNLVGTVRRVDSLRVSRQGSMVYLDITGNGFLYNMVRIIAGTLMEIGEGKYPPEHMKDILEAASRAAAGPTAPARGLTLVKMEYENDPRKEVVH